MRFDLKDFKKDPDLVTSGVWIPLGGDAAFKIASFDNPAFTEAFRKATKPYSDLGREIPEKDQEQIMADCLSRFIVLDWKGVFENDVELPYSPESAKRVLIEFPDVLKIVIEQAKKVSNFREGNSKVIEGNSLSA